MSNSARLAIRRKRSRVWDPLTITLAVAVILLGIAILLLPKSESPSRSDDSPKKEVPAYMAQQVSPTGLVTAASSSHLA